MTKKVVLAFSGGLDTSYCAKYLSEDCGYEVYSLTVNSGGFTSSELEEIKNRAYALGVKHHSVAEETENFYQTCIRFLIYGNILKNNTYPLSVSAERMVQAIAVANYAKQIGADAVAHGSTGAGNDQVRFDMAFHALIPDVEIITPIRDNKLSREEEIEFLRKNGVEMDFSKARYSINKGIWGTSVGGKETLTSHLPLPEEAYPTQVTNHSSLQVTLHFEKGELKGINESKYNNPADAIRELQSMAEPFGIGRDMHIGDTIIGIKGRVGFEAAAPLIIIKAHHTLEKHVLTKWQLYWKDQLAAWYGNWLHEGHFLDPVMRDLESFMASTQQHVTGHVYVQLLPYRFQVLGIESPFDLMQSGDATYGEMNNAWTADDVKGFAKIFGNQTRIYNQVHAAVNAEINEN